jgi:hypothetical protein
LLLAAWLSLGEVGAQRLPHWAGGLLPLALWLLAITAALQVARHRPPTAAVLVRGLPLLGLAAAALVLEAGRGDTAAVLLLAPVWAALLVLASHTVRGLRRGSALGLPRSSTPVVPACLGGLLALAGYAAQALPLPSIWLWPGGSTNQSLATALLLLLASLLLGALVPADVARAGACRAGLFDCSLPLAGSAARPTGSAGRQPIGAAWPLRSASLLMLPMMAALPAMAPWCSGVLGGPALVTLHLASMLLPALLLSLWPVAPVPRPDPSAEQRRLGRVIAAWLGAGCLGWAMLPDNIGLLALALCHGCAWSLAWAGPMLAVERRSHAPAPWAAGGPDRRAGDLASDHRQKAQPSATPNAAHHGLGWLAQAVAAPVLVLALGWSLANLGATALIGVHLALALWAIAGVWLSHSLELLARSHGPIEDHPAQAMPAVAPPAPPGDHGFATAPTWRADLP